MIKFNCKQSDFLYALNTVNKATDQNSTLPVLNNILIVNDQGTVTLSATNLEISIKYSFKVENSEDGKITIPAKLLSSYVALLSDKDLEISGTDDLSLKVKTGSSETKIKGIDAMEFPILPEIKGGANIEISARDLAKIIERVAFSASNNISRPVLTGVYLNIKGDELKVAATDGYRLSECKYKLKKAVDAEISCIIPAKTLMELSKVLVKYDDEDDKTVNVNIDKNQIEFKVQNFQMTSRLIEGKFHDYEKIIPQETKTKIEINSEDLMLALRRVSLFARENNNNVRFLISKDKGLTIFTDETRVGEEKAHIDAKVDGEENKIALNAQYLIDVLSNTQTSKCIIGVNDKLFPVSFRGIDIDGFVYIIMPLKI